MGPMGPTGPSGPCHCRGAEFTTEISDMGLYVLASGDKLPFARTAAEIGSSIIREEDGSIVLKEQGFYHIVFTMNTCSKGQLALTLNDAPIYYSIKTQAGETKITQLMGNTIINVTEADSVLAVKNCCSSELTMLPGIFGTDDPAARLIIVKII